MKKPCLLQCLAVLSLTCRLSVAGSDEAFDSSVKAIQAVGPEGRGNPEAALAWRHLAGQPLARLPQVLGAMDGANDLAANWVQAAVDAITERARREGAPLPLLSLGTFLLDPQHHPRARSLAFDLIAQTHPDTAQSLLPGLLNDPSVDLRRLAVQTRLDLAQTHLQAGETNAALLLYRQTLGFARDIPQIQQINAQLKKWNQPVDLPRHFGFLMDWHVIGPFHNTAGGGFAESFPPETEIDLSASYPGKSGPVRWQPLVSTHDYGRIDLNPACGQLKEVTAYAYAEFHAATARPAELRLGCKNAWKIWFNGSFLFGREEYHRGQQIDQYSMPVSLQPGPNRILVKVCQNEMVEDWTREWEFQLRVCDATGTALLSTNRPPTLAASLP